MAETTIDMGPGTHAIPLSLFRDNRNRVNTELTRNPSVDASTFVLLQGGDSIPFYDTDTEYVFRQVKFSIFKIVTHKIDAIHLRLYSGIIFHVFLWSSRAGMLWGNQCSHWKHNVIHATFAKRICNMDGTPEFMHRLRESICCRWSSICWRGKCHKTLSANACICNYQKCKNLFSFSLQQIDAFFVEKNPSKLLLLVSEELIRTIPDCILCLKFIFSKMFWANKNA